MRLIPRLPNSQLFKANVPFLPTFLNRRFSSKHIHVEMATVNTTDRLARLRELMKERNVDVYSVYLPVTRSRLTSLRC
jgi:hypothetical protein